MFKKYFISIFITLALLVLIYSLFKSEIIYDGNRREFYSFYIILSLIFILIGIVLSYLKEKITVIFSINLFAFLFTIYAFEFYASYLKTYRIDDLNIDIKSEIFKKKFGKNYDTRNIYDYFLSQKKINSNLKIDINTVNLLQYKQLEIIPLSGYSNSEVILCNEFGYYKHIKTDRYGFNNVDSVWDDKKINFVYIGDSFIEGYCQDEKNTIPYKLTKILRGSNINLGQGGAGSLQGYATLLEYLPENTQGIIWFITDNDIDDLQKEILNKKLYRYLIEKSPYQNLISQQKKVDDTFNYVFKYSENRKKVIIFKRFVKLSYTRSFIHSFIFKNNLTKIDQKNYDTDRLKYFVKIMENIKDLSLEKKINLYVIYLPTFNNYLDGKYINKDYEYIQNTLRRLNIEYLDINKEIFTLEKNPKDLFPFGFYGHYNNNGSDKISEAIFKFVVK